jgi:hypothetical protein
MGTYSKMANLTQADRPVFKRVGSTVMYLFYAPSVSIWIVGSNYTSSSGNIRSSGNSGAACPDLVTAWLVYNGSAWVGTYPINVVQTPVGNAPATSACGLRTGTLGVPPHALPADPKRLHAPSAFGGILASLH